MSIFNDFENFCDNIKLDNMNNIETSSGEIAKKLNDVYYNIKGETNDHMYIVGSVGRKTAIKGSSDIDLIFDLPNEVYKKFDAYEINGQSSLLQEVKNYLIERYPNTDLSADGQVVVINFINYTVELVPGFKQSDDRFKYPDTNDGGSWKLTDPIPEKIECDEFNKTTDGNFMNFCHMIRKWKNNKEFKFGGLLIDTLVYNFFKENESYYTIKYEDYLEVLKKLYNYLKDLNKDQSYWFALGSNQKVYNRDNGKFVGKAQDAYDSINESTNYSDDINDKLRDLFGNDFPSNSNQQRLTSDIIKYDNTEEFIEDKVPVDIRNSLKIDCNVIQDGWRTRLLSFINKNNLILRKNRKLDFFIKDTDVEKPFDIYWKVRNVGKIAIERNCIRGKVEKTNNSHHNERTDFIGPHYVECYVVKNGICVARDRISVPISNDV